MEIMNIEKLILEKLNQEGTVIRLINLTEDIFKKITKGDENNIGSFGIKIALLEKLYMMAENKEIMLFEYDSTANKMNISKNPHKYRNSNIEYIYARTNYNRDRINLS